jgi:hypothetical protein
MGIVTRPQHVLEINRVPIVNSGGVSDEGIKAMPIKVLTRSRVKSQTVRSTHAVKSIIGLLFE